MATSLEYIEIVCERLLPFGDVRYKKMFGDYMAYLNEKPIASVCDNNVFVKIRPELAELMGNADKGFPYEGAKLHYILDIDDAELLQRLIPLLESITPLPKPRKKKI